MFLWYFAWYFCGILLGVFVVNEISDIWNDYLTLWQVAAGCILASRMRMWSMWLAISARLSRNDKLGQNDDNCKRDMGILLISLLAEEGVSTVLTLNLTCLTTSWGGRFFYLTRPLLLGEAPPPPRLPLLRRGLQPVNWLFCTRKQALTALILGCTRQSIQASLMLCSRLHENSPPKGVAREYLTQ